jgi:DNA-binding SARP family transcriptional activator/tetratricopeptide (TPR) repeat protein
MDFQILGPLEVCRAGRPVSLGAAKQRALLAILLLHANEIVSRDLLIDGLWGAHPPASAPNAVQVYVAQLRKALEPGRSKGTPTEILLTRPGGYSLHVEADAVDAERVERLSAEGSSRLAAGDPASAAPLLHEALDLWRGPPLADFTYEPFAQAEIARLEELRLSTLEERLEADLALGGHGSVIGQLEALVREHPLRERLRGQLMLALYRAGRQAEALESFRDARRVLTDELGIVPGPELQRLEGAILRQDPELDVEPAETPAQPPAAAVSELASERRKTVTVLVAVAATPAGADPESIRPLAERHHAAASEVIDSYGGSVESALGDRVMGVFGVPRVREDDALRAVRAAADLRDRAQGEAGVPVIRSGVASGEVVAAATGSRGASVTGHPVTFAAELANAAAFGEILLAENTHELLGEAGRSEPAKGSADGAWRLIELVPRPPPLARRPQRPLVGRDGELAQLEGALERASRERTAYLFTILGSPGIGKSRLGEEFASRVGSDAGVVAGRCVAYGEGITFWPLREIVRGLTADASLPEVLGGEEDGDFVAARVTEAIGSSQGTPSVEEIFWAFQRLFGALARDRPLVVIFEDVHWAEPTLLDFIEYLAERARNAPILLICLARPELLETRPSWGGGKPNASSLLLESLTEGESDQLIDSIASGLPDATRAEVREAADGNPLFLEQLVAMLSDRRESAGEIQIPPTIQAVLAARIDRLGPGERAVIERAAVVGKEFWREAVAELLPDVARPFAARHLEALVDKELVRPVRSLLPGQDAFRFRHVLIQQASYRAVAKRVRAELHERAATWHEGIAGGSAEQSEIAGYHLEQAYRYRVELGPIGEQERELASRAAERLGSAGERAFRRGDMPASAGLLARAAALLPEDDRARPELLSDLGYALFEVGELDRANSTLGEAVEAARERGDAGIEWSAIVKLGNVRMYTEPERMDPEGLVRDASTAIEVLEGLGDELGLARAWGLLSEARWITGAMTEAAEASRWAAQHGRRAGSPREESWGLGAYAMALLYGPTPAPEARATTERLLREAAGSLVTEANLFGFLAAHEAMTGRIEEARGHIEQSCERLLDLGLRWQLGVQELLGGYVELLGGDPVASERYMRAARDSFIAIGDRWFLSTVAVDLPRPVYEQGRYEDARVLVEAIDEVPAPADSEWQVKRRGIRARLLAREGRVEEAERIAREGVAVAAQTDQLWFHADAVIDLADVLRMAGRQEEAAGTAAEALALCERKGNVASAAVARGLLGA